MPLVSVIIPAYNSGPYLDEAVRSVIAQTFTDWECIVVDDGSTEDLSRVEKMDSRVRLIRQPNRGVSAARNNGILATSSEYVAFLDHDDLWFPGKLEKQAAILAADPAVGLCYTGFDIMDKDGLRVGPGWGGNCKNYCDALRDAAGSVASFTMVRRALFAATGLFDPLFPLVQDYDLNLRFARVCKLHFVPEILGYYRRHAGNASSDFAATLPEANHALRAHALPANEKRFPGVGNAVAAGCRANRRALGVQAYEAARASARQRKLRQFAGRLAVALAWNPPFTLRALAKFPAQRISRLVRPSRPPTE